MKLENKVYNVLKWITQIVLPAIGTLYFALAQIWNLPYSEQVVGTISAVTAFLGITLGVSTKSYKKNGMDGILDIDTSSAEADMYSFTMDESTLYNLPGRDELYLRVRTDKK